MSSTPTPEALTPARTASALGVSVDTLRRWEKAGRITAHRTPGGQRRFPTTEIERLRNAEAGVSER